MAQCLKVEESAHYMDELTNRFFLAQVALILFEEFES